MIWFHLSTDHMPFLEAPIGIPAVTFTNMPDRYIHSSDDDLWNIDATQLGRNAVAAATIAYVMASADSSAVAALAAETNGRGLVRLAQNLRLGPTWIATATARAAAYLDAVDQVRYAAERERMALTSLAQVHATAGTRAAPFAAEVDRRATRAMRSSRTPTDMPPGGDLPAAHGQRHDPPRRPAPCAGRGARFLKARRDPVPGLHSYGLRDVTR
jgi:hypothetical protein